MGGVAIHSTMGVLKVRPATSDDCRTLWEWANDLETRAASFHPEPIEWEQHVSWFKKKLADQNCLFLIGTVDEVPVGVVRFDIVGSHAELSITIGPAYRGRGYGKAMLGLATDEVLRTGRVHCIDAFVKPSNLRSACAFKSAGFRKVGVTQRHGQQVLWFRKGVTGSLATCMDGPDGDGAHG